MPKVLLFLDKYSDWLESYSYFFQKKDISLDIFIVSNDRNDFASINQVYMTLLENSVTSRIHSFDDKQTLFENFSDHSKSLRKGDVLIAPLIRYRALWKLVRGLTNRNIETIHLSECLPDAFGTIGYRFGFRGFTIKNILSLPYFIIFQKLNTPSICYYPLYPAVKNPFVKKTIAVKIPKANDMIELNSEFNLLFDGKKRPLIIDGFGYNHAEIALKFNITSYIATSKNREIIIDGTTFPLLGKRICAEELLFMGIITKVYSYNSSVVTWAANVFRIPIICFKSNGLDHKFGSLFSYYSSITLKKIGVKLSPSFEL